MQVAPTGYGSIRAGETVLDELADLARDLGVGTGLVVYDQTALQLGHVDLAIGVLQKGRLRFTSHAIREGGQCGELNAALAALSKLDGGLVISLGEAQTLSLGKEIAAAANNGDLSSYVGFDGLPRSPIPHIAIPTTMWPPEEVTDVIRLGSSGAAAQSSIRDPRLAPVAVIDGRLHGHHGRDVQRLAHERALNVAVCAATDPLASLDQHARALAAAHPLAGSLAGTLRLSGLESRIPISLAGACHPDYSLCSRCQSGHRFTADTFGDPPTPTEACLREALNGRRPETLPSI